jgi:pimeloyl-ACP methyl ester carboxylesterase
MIDDAMTLPDGRTLAFTEIGDPDGPVAFHFHGAPGGRLELAGLDEAFTAAGVRVITADRPGYGGSTLLLGRTVADWADDVVALADHLGVEHFAVTGISSGGPYAVACAALLGERVCGAVIAAGVTDMSWPGAGDGYLQAELDIMAIDDEPLAVRYCEERFGADGSRFFEGDMDLGPVDNAFVADEANATTLFASMAEAFRQGVVGYAHDITVQGRPWDFDPTSITVATIVVHGTDDRLVPIAHSRHTADLIPGSELRIMAGRGHLTVGEELPSLTAEVLGIRPLRFGPGETA